jgi:basic membrane protein A
MAKFTFRLGCIIFVLLVFFTSCKQKPIVAPQKIWRVGLVGGLGGFNDAGFNQNIMEGYLKAAHDFPLNCQSFEVTSVDDFSKGINYFLANGIDLIITIGFDASQATIDAANANPGIDFVIIDYAMASPPPNLLCVKFDVDQASFPCGFLAAYWAHKQNYSNPVTGFVAGPEIPEIRQFSVSYLNGVEYFNKQYKKNVASLGYYATSFADTLEGAKLADSLIRQNASVIFAFAGKTGNGALYKAREAGKWAIGVDVDQYYSIPAVGPVLLTSCMKELDVMVYQIMFDYYYLKFSGGTIIHGNLNNGGVGKAPYHDYDALIPDSIKTALADIEAGIMHGTISTGWTEK